MMPQNRRYARPGPRRFFLRAVNIPRVTVPIARPVAPHTRAVRRRATPRSVVAVSAWRIVIIVFALLGLQAALAEADTMSGALTALSQQASLLAAIVYAGLLVYPAVTGFTWLEPGSAWLRIATAMTLLLVMGVFMTELSGSLESRASLFEHLLTPLIVLVDVLFVGRAQLAARWEPLTWIVFSVAYLVYYNVKQLTIYEGSIVLRWDNARFLDYVPVYAFGLIGVGFLLLAVHRLRLLIDGG